MMIKTFNANIANLAMKYVSFLFYVADRTIQFIMLLFL